MPIDKDIPVAATLTDLEICHAVCEQDQAMEVDNSGGNKCAIENPLMNTETRQALEIFKHGVQHCSTNFLKNNTNSTTQDSEKSFLDNNTSKQHVSVLLRAEETRTFLGYDKMTHRKKHLTLEEAMLLFDELNSDSDLEVIYTEPPDVAVVSDEDSAEGGGLADNLSGCQLCVNVEISEKITEKNIWV
ncbi:hypothetical protein AVEN_65195-1 [Araneus ventricosus]|uniref:Uncharacterized protein n=1 Tax=Araneus ventricosus TaxID=182803 RepID=A0A4Y2AI16_ARAVE|nr:hypothetical protein AVEN_65195-1 [Araneus ventricosus]